MNRNLLSIKQARYCLRYEIATAIRQRVELPDFAAEFDAWIYKANEELRVRADEDRKRVDIDDTISNAVQSGAASSIIFLLVVATLLAPLVSMCTQE